MALGSRLLLLSSLFAVTSSSTVWTEGCGRVFVTISPLLIPIKTGELVEKRLAQVNWDYLECTANPGTAAIFEMPDSNPEPSYDLRESAWRAAISGSQGFAVSNYSVPRNLPGGWGDRSTFGRRGKHCYPFLAAVYDISGAVLNTTRLCIYPTWMQDLALTGSDRRLTLTSTMLPGTHNSGCYSRSGEVDNHMIRYLLTQDVTVWEQLVHGVRYFDLRVGYYPQNMGEQENETHPDHGHRFWVNHDMVRVQPLQPVLRDIALFLAGASGEFVILDFHRFPVGFSVYDEYAAFLLSEPHKDLLTLIKTELGNYIIPHSGYNPLPNLYELRRSGGRVLVSYGDKRWLMKERWLWPPIPQLWGNQQSLEGLVEYLDNAMDTWAARHGTLWAAMAELTPTMGDVLFNFGRRSLRSMAHSVNHNISLKARRSWFKKANIIATDFFLGTDITQIAIESNIQRAAEKIKR